MSTTLVVLTPEQLEQLVERAVERALSRVFPAAPPELDLTSEQAAEALNLAPKTIRRLAREGKLPGKRRGSTWRFTRRAVEAYRAGGSSESLLKRTLDHLGVK